MQELEKILEEIGELRGQAGSECTSEDHYIKKAWEHCLDRVAGIIRKHMNDSQCGECSRRRWYQIGYKDGKRMNDGWIPVEERLPEDEIPTPKLVTALVPDRKARWDNSETFHVIVDTDVYDPGYAGTWDCYRKNVIAWRPLPEPYAGKE